MKSILFALTLALVILFAGISAMFGIGIMIYNLYSSGPNFMQGFTVFCLGATLFFSGTVAYIVTKILTNTDILADSLVKLIEHQEQHSGPQMNPLQALFQKFGMQGMGGPGIIKTSLINEDGTITPLEEKKFSSNKERDDIIFRAFNSKPGKKNIQDMTIQELKDEEKKAVESQNFELAAAIRDLMNEKNNNKD
jgi:hypothetical protein